MTETLEKLRSAKRIGYLFSGGSMRCIFQVGVAEELFALGVTPSVCLGVSGGVWNAAAVAVGNTKRLRAYWRFFSRMPHIDIRNLVRERSPFIWSRLHERSFARYVGTEALRASAIPVLVALRRLRDQQLVIRDARESADPLRLMLASNFLPPFYSQTPLIEEERYGDAGLVNNLPYEVLFEMGCDAVVAVASKGESEGGLYRNPDDFEHEIATEFRERVVVIRPRHRLPLGFVERRWDRLVVIANLGSMRTREVLLGESHPATEQFIGSESPTLRLAKLRKRFLQRRQEDADSRGGLR